MDILHSATEVYIELASRHL